MSANTNNSNNTSSHHPPITSKNDGNGKIVHQKGATTVAATTATNTTAITTTTSHHQVPFDNTENGDKHNTHNTNRDDALNGTAATILLDELDDEILHAEEADLMLKHYKQLQEKVRWETRGQHNEQFYDMINSTSSNTISRGSAKTGKGVSRNARQREPPAKRTKKNQETSKSSHASAVILDDGVTPKYGTESILLLAKSRRRGRDRITTSSSNHTVPNPSQPRRRRPRLQLMDPNTESTMTTTSGRNTAVLHDSIEIIHDLQLIRATTLLPRMFTNSTTNNNFKSSTNSTDHEVVRTEWKKKELERFLYTKFVKSCIGHCRIYCMYHHPLDGDMSKNIYWKHFRIQLQSANANSWRCIVIGYRAMVNDVLLFLRQLKLIGQQNHHRNVDDNTSITATTSSAASSTA